MKPHSTLSAVDDVTGNIMSFSDYVDEGQQVDLFRDPDEERGFFGMRLLYRDGRGVFRLRELTADENEERTRRIAARFTGTPPVGAAAMPQNKQSAACSTTRRSAEMDPK
jgi:hypothetical protein